jgi:dGTPase
MFERVYLGKQARAEHAKIARVIRTLFEHYCEHPAELPGGRADLCGAPLAASVTDYLAGMTDRFCLRSFEALAVPRGFM